MMMFMMRQPNSFVSPSPPNYFYDSNPYSFFQTSAMPPPAIPISTPVLQTNERDSAILNLTEIADDSDSSDDGKRKK